MKLLAVEINISEIESIDQVLFTSILIEVMLNEFDTTLVSILSCVKVNSI